ncbi:hypothetical protein HU200_014983 [Digitaria exilis]|uniref:Uncharacterized protein n=1 Tax=Digitaria exilis TaxID=1010633 RepID=A0A835KJT0_9POAL|nr:hypothetical protein HU200_014983 [Digitaria exilis]
MAPASKPSDPVDDALQAAIDGDLRLLKSETSVHFAAVGGDERVLRYLLDHGGDPAVPDGKGSTPLHDAAEQGVVGVGGPVCTYFFVPPGHYEAVRLLLSKGVDVDPVNHRGTPLHLAAAKDRDQVVKILLEHGADAGADVNFISPSGLTVLMKAADDGLTDMVKFLLQSGADPNIADEDGKIPIMFAAVHGHRELVEILFPKTRPIPSVPDWSVDGIIRSMKFPRFEAQDPAVVGERLADAKAQGKEAFAKGEYVAAIYFYGLVLLEPISTAMELDPLDVTLLANRSLCWLRLGEGDRALLDAQQCRMMSPRWSKAWYREGAALRLLKDYKGAVDAFMQALKLDPASEEIGKALRQMLFLPSICTFY